MFQITLKAARVNVGKTQAQVAADIEVSLATLKNWESGRSFPKQPDIEKLCKYYGLAYDNLLFLPKKLAKS